MGHPNLHAQILGCPFPPEAGEVRQLDVPARFADVSVVAAALETGTRHQAAKRLSVTDVRRHLLLAMEGKR